MAPRAARSPLPAPEQARRAPRPLDVPGSDPAVARAPLAREIHAAADYLRFLRRELGQLGANEIAKSRIPAAALELDAIIEETARSSNAIMTAAEQVMAARSLPPEQFQEVVAERMTAIFVACAFQDLVSQRAERVRATLRGLERRLSRVATVMGTRAMPDLVDYAGPDGGSGAAGGPAASPPMAQEEIDRLLADWPEPDETA